MTFLAVPLARLALSFGPADYVALMVLSFALLGTMSEGKAVKTWIAVALGLVLAMVGVDGGTGVERFTFGSLELLGGIDFTSLTIGLFAVAEILILAEGLVSGVVSRSSIVSDSRSRVMAVAAVLAAINMTVTNSMSTIMDSHNWAWSAFILGWLLNWPVQ